MTAAEESRNKRSLLIEGDGVETRSDKLYSAKPSLLSHTYMLCHRLIYWIVSLVLHNTPLAPGVVFALFLSCYSEVGQYGRQGISGRAQPWYS